MQRFIICKENNKHLLSIYHYTDVIMPKEGELGRPVPKEGTKPILTNITTLTEAEHHCSVIERRHGFNSVNYQNFIRRQK